MLCVLLTHSTVPEGELSVHTHLWRGGCAARLGAAQLQMGKLQRQSGLCQASFQRRQQLTFGWTAEHTKTAAQETCHILFLRSCFYVLKHPSLAHDEL